MDMALVRNQWRPDGIFSAFIDADGKQRAITLEHAYDDGNGGWKPKIPNGTYVCKRYMSPHFGFEVFQVMDVPNCQNIEIHCGNFDKDSEGCILLGEAEAMSGSAEMVTNSKVTFHEFMALQAGLDEFNLVVS